MSCLDVNWICSNEKLRIHLVLVTVLPKALGQAGLITLLHDVNTPSGALADGLRVYKMSALPAVS